MTPLMISKLVALAFMLALIFSIQGMWSYRIAHKEARQSTSTRPIVPIPSSNATDAVSLTADQPAREQGQGLASVKDKQPKKQGLDLTDMSYVECFDYLNRTADDLDYNQKDQNWTRLNNLPETKQLIQEAGGLTTLMEVFMKTYEDKLWGKGSGKGSWISFAAPTICTLSQQLPHLLKVTLMIDIPCGDQQWAPMLRQMTPGLKYIGVDIMPGLISTHRERFKTNGEPYNQNLEFFLADMSQTNVFEMVRKKSKIWKPTDTVAVLSRHVLEHNKYATIFKYFKELKASGATYFIGTNAAKWPKNKPLGVLGGFRFLNFHIHPFFFPPAIVTWTEDIYNKAGGKDGPFTEIAVWRVSDIPSSFHENVRG
mmetsp:Transcript_13927/g.27515  ORF Transcript_13927/g.27515 Transcript_13927/m.27515 type:complete len:369 (-) Transcript_13927:128-1234(-)